MREMWCPTCDLTLPAPGSRCPSCATVQEKPASYWIRVFLVALWAAGTPQY
ncbi:hypothetical protein GPX89_03710 [Nocardia sp. ET3-3]|uniref:Uncharacterized protein n=1 Tax=Nocardia terrae TaxID=2675851 RepID=A0A7K1UR50_9NOCA|nr:hypothetical protein [Nocardia terrae]MVU76348.1 hypothetical protein [Nocardia terrae]